MSEPRQALAIAIAALRSHLESENALPASSLPLPPTLAYLGNCFALSPLEQAIVLLCVALELDPAITALCNSRQGLAYPTFALAFELFREPSWDVMSSEQPLRYWRLIEVGHQTGVFLMLAPLRLDDRILNFLLGSNRLDPRLAALMFPIVPPLETQLPTLAPSQLAVVKQLLQTLESLPLGQPWPLIQLLGSDTASKQQVAQGGAAQLGRSLWGFLGELLPVTPVEFTELLRCWQREEQLLALALYVDTQEVTTGSASSVALRRFLSQNPGLVFLDSQRVSLPPNRAVLTVEVQKPTPSEQRQAWLALLPPKRADAQGLAGQFDLSWPDIATIATTTPPETSVWTAAVQQNQPCLERLAQRIEVKAQWEQLVLPEAERDLLQQIVEQVRWRSQVYEDWGFRGRLNRGLGTAALFAGESGTGKTMAAEVVAGELALQLYRIDLSAVVSKYIGETEKNLRQLFDAAESGGAILFFDEADSLFGKRSEVKDSHDRYANIGIDYLLQRLEAYRGLAILATNFKDALDTAFLRRLRFVVEFPFPSVELREQLWRRVFPAAVPLAALDYGQLARLNLTGGAISNIAINAAFRAAALGEAVGMVVVMAAVRAELEKLGRPGYEVDFVGKGEEDWGGSNK
ncbi:MAG: ATP-binding protein [Spirulina sp. SIO3F2]|nr:ATP-binding protein [Spirulina sp. SIO3F2]